MRRAEEVNRLVEDSAFLRYHAEHVKRPKFNAFDVLRYSEYEIRHSNVMAWLLDPGETHGIGREFLEWFLGQARLPGKMPGKIVRGDGGQTVRVERELYYVDIVIFLESDQGRHIVAIENKPGWAWPEHYEQVRGHKRRLRPKYPGHDIHCVLLSTSPEGIDGEDKIAHVSWRNVGAQIKTTHDADGFRQGEVAAFIRQYLVAVDRLIGLEESDAHFFRKLLDDHHSLLKRMFKAVIDGGDDRVRGDGAGASRTLSGHRGAVGEGLRAGAGEVAVGSSRPADESRNRDDDLRQQRKSCAVAELGPARNTGAWAWRDWRAHLLGRPICAPQHRCEAASLPWPSRCGASDRSLHAQRSGWTAAAATGTR